MTAFEGRVSKDTHSVLLFFVSALLIIGILYDFWTLNDRIDEINRGWRLADDSPMR